LTTEKICSVQNLTIITVVSSIDFELPEILFTEQGVDLKQKPQKNKRLYECRARRKQRYDVCVYILVIK
jgi:hypothetical protein